MSAARGQRLQILLRALSVLLAAGLLLFFAGRQRWRLDLSPSRQHSLEARTAELLAALPAAPRITLYLPDREPERSRAAALFGACQARRPDLSWTLVDPGREPARALAAGVEAPGEVLIEVGAASQRFSAERGPGGDYLLDERALARALRGLARGADGAPRLALVQAPGLRPLGSASQPAGPEGLDGLAALLDAEGWQVDPWWAISEPAPPRETLLLLAGPHRRLPPRLLAALDAHLGAGGALCLLVDPAAELADSSGDAGLGPLLAGRGIALGAGFVVDLSEENLALERGFEVPVATRYAPHPATRSFLARPEPTCFPLARALDLSGEGAGAPRALLVSSDRSFEERGPFDGSAHLDERVDRRGPFVLAAASDSSAQGGGPLLVVGDSHFVTAGQLDWYGNARLILGALAWLGADRVAPGGEPPPVSLLPITRAGRQLYDLLSLLALPLALVALWPLRLWLARRGRRSAAPGGPP
ncbi:hypothetical protein FJ251_05140 [bacterium]|nr:hypothetical protein [bacterium]